LLARGAEALQTTSQQLTVPQKPVEVLAIRRWPRTQDDKEKWGREITETLLSLLRDDRLSEADRKSFLAGNPPASALKQLGELIIQQAGIYGWRIRLSRPVMALVAQWYEEGGESLEFVRRFDNVILRRARIAHGEAKGTITDPRWYSARPDAVGELRVLLRQFKDEVRLRRHRKPNVEEVCKWFLKKIAQSSDALPWLSSGNVPGLLRYLEYIGRDGQARFNHITNGDERAEDLFVGWGSWSENVSENTFRQRLSQIGRSKRPRTLIQKAPSV
jgi:hypothetical protein